MTDILLDIYDNAIPALQGGDYTLTVEQSVVLPTQFDSPLPYQFTQNFTVDGPHIALGANGVEAVYPPSGAQGQFDDVLPHVVLNQRTLPWQINPGGAATPSTPWLALLLLEPTDFLTPPANGTGTQTVPLAQYFIPPSSTTQGPVISSQEQQAWIEQFPNANVTVIDVLWQSWLDLAPGLGELPYLAHVREVEATGDWYSVIVGNRLSAGTATYIAQLVSVEGMTSFLPGQNPAITPTAIRLLSLASWTYSTVATPGDFATLMQNLDDGLLQMPPSLVGGTTTQPEQFVVAALNDGYTGLQYETRLGEPTVAWYRGPAIPQLLEANFQPAYPSAEAALLYDQTTGMFDVSYAAAWQTARLLTLANRQVVVQLLQLVNGGLSQLQLLAERRQLLADHDQLEVDDASLLERGAIRDAVRRYLARKVAPKLTDARPDVTPLLGRRADRSDLAKQGRSMRGRVRREELDRATKDGLDPNIALVDLARAKGRSR